MRKALSIEADIQMFRFHGLASVSAYHQQLQPLLCRRYMASQQPPICSWCTSRVSPSAISSCGTCGPLAIAACVGGSCAPCNIRRAGPLGFTAHFEREKEERHTLSGLSVGWTRAPSKRKRTVAGCFPCRSQKASMSFFRAVVRLILKKTSL